jgi:RNA polymerase sigma factor (TIGR02999 family)
MVFEESRREAQSLISSLLAAAEEGDSSAVEALFPALYSELHRMAERQLIGQANLTLSPTTLLHKTYINLAERNSAAFPDEARFLGYAARVMRGLIIDHARSRRVQKRGGQFTITLLDIDPGDGALDNRELTLIGEALDELAQLDEELAELVDLKFFSGFSFAEIAAMRNISERTVQRNWEKARIYLHRAIRPDLPV